MRSWRDELRKAMDELEAGDPEMCLNYDCEMLYHAGPCKPYQMFKRGESYQKPAGFKPSRVPDSLEEWCRS